MESSVCEKGLLEYEIMTRKTNPPPFLLKTYMLVDDPANDGLISWNEGGTAFVVWQPAEFARDLLPTLFKHSNFSSFVRQLNTYGFKKVATSRWEFCNDKFLKGKREMIGQIQRRKAWSNNRRNHPTMVVPPVEATSRDADEDQRSFSTSSSSELTTLVDENKRLKQENGFLSTELTTMKKKCKELIDLVAIYSKQEEGIDVENGHEDGDEEKLPMLFGVRLDVHGGEKKRKRTSVVYESSMVVLSESCK